jgi:hypothetical protein
MVSLIVNIGLLLGVLGLIVCFVPSGLPRRNRAQGPRWRVAIIGSLVLVLSCLIAGIAINSLSERRCLGRFELIADGMDTANVKALLGEPMEHTVADAGIEFVYNIPKPVTWFWSAMSRSYAVSSRVLVVCFDTENRVIQKHVRRSICYFD